MAQDQTPKIRVIEFKTRGNNKTVRYALTETDFLTLARAIEFEGPPQTAVVWTLLQRFAFLYPLYKDLASFVKAYAQPINPDWFPNGKRHLAWVESLRKAGKTAEAEAEIKQAARRPANATTPLEKLTPKNVFAVENAFLNGAQSPVPGSTHYRAPTIRTRDADAARKARAAFAQAKNMIALDIGEPTRENWFFGELGSSSFAIRLLSAAAGSAGLVVVCILSAAALAYILRSS